MGVEGKEPWWKLEGADQAKAVYEAAGELRRRQTWRWAQLELAFCLYDDASGSDLETNDFAFSYLEGETRTPLNLVRSACDTVRAELIQVKPRPFALPTGADWEVRRKCQQLNKFLAGLLSSQAFDRTASRLALDMLVFGTCAVRPVVEDDQVRLERVPIWEIWVDADEARYGEPQTLYLTRYASRATLAARYPDQAEAIERATGSHGGRRMARSADLVAVVEAWHLRSARGAGDGRHVIAVDEAVLFEEEWDHDWFPIAFGRWKEPPQGFWGEGLAGELAEPQRDLNRAVYAAQVGQRLNTFPRILASRQAGLNIEHLTDEPGAILWYNGGTAPSALVWPGVSPEIYQWIRDTIAWGYQLAGVSTSAARAERAAGLASGEAIKMNADLQSRRFLDPQREFEQLHVDVGRTIVRVVEHYARSSRGLAVVYQGRHRAERIDWTGARLDESSFVMRIEPVSSLPFSPAGRVDYVQGLISSGFAQQAGLPPQMAARALVSPDTEHLQQFVSIAFDLVEQICERILDEGEDCWEEIYPEPLYNLSVCFLVAIVTYQQWKVWGVPPDRLDLLRDWIDVVRDMLEREAQASEPAPAPPMTAPDGATEAA
jgi:hypothetical protein